MRLNLKVFRTKQKLTQTEMGEKIGVSRQVYANVENGRNAGSTEFWDGLQQAFDVPDEEMYNLMKLDA